MEPKRLYRSQTDRKFAGVAGGLAEYFVMDPLLIRLAFVVLTLAGGGGVLIYIILWIVTPENPVRIHIQPGQQTQSPPASEPSANNSGESYSYAAPDSNGTNFTDPVQPAQAPPVKKRQGSLIGGLVLITVGALFLADELIPQVNFGDLWPVILIVIGIGLLINTVTKRNQLSNNP